MDMGVGSLKSSLNTALESRIVNLNLLQNELYRSDAYSTTELYRDDKKTTTVATKAHPNFVTNSCSLECDIRMSVLACKQQFFSS